MVALRGLFLLPVLGSFALLAPGCAQDEAVPIAGDESNIEATAEGLFESNAAFAFKLDAPFTKLFSDLDKYYAGTNPDPGQTEAAGKLTFGKKSLDVQVSVRGNSSVTECSFKKLKVEFTNKDQTAGTPFAGTKKFRINSHCADGKVTDHTEGYGRVMNQVGPVREELAYRIVKAAGLETYRTRLSTISYTDTSAEKPFAPLDRYGLVIESGSEAADRFVAEGKVAKEAKYLNGANNEYGEPEEEGAELAKMNQADVASIEMIEAILGNFDWSFDGSNFAGQGSGGPQGIWNIDVFGVPHQATQLPIPQDFDLSVIVKGANDKTTKFPHAIEAFHKLCAKKTSSCDEAVKRFKDHKSAILAEIQSVEAADIASKAIPSKDGKVSSDPGFVAAHQLFDAFYAMPELE